MTVTQKTPTRQPTITFSVPQDLMAILQRVAKSEDRKVAALTRILVKEALRTRGKLND